MWVCLFHTSPLRRVPEIDMVMGPQYANRLGDLLEGVFNGNQIVATAPTHIMEDPTQPQRASTTCAWVNVIYGCNERCSYCVVPTTRGSEQSRPREAIQKEIDALLADGYMEVMTAPLSEASGPASTPASDPPPSPHFR